MTGPLAWWPLAWGPLVGWPWVFLIVASNIRADSRIIVETLYREKSPRGVIICIMNELISNCAWIWEGWLLLDIVWFVLFLNSRVTLRLHYVNYKGPYYYFDNTTFVGSGKVGPLSLRFTTLQLDNCFRSEWPSYVTFLWCLYVTLYALSVIKRVCHSSVSDLFPFLLTEIWLRPL